MAKLKFSVVCIAVNKIIRKQHKAAQKAVWFNDAHHLEIIGLSSGDSTIPDSEKTMLHKCVCVCVCICVHICVSGGREREREMSPVVGLLWSSHMYIEETLS